MDRKINWTSGCFDEIELVYEKAAQNERIGSLVEQLETQALEEVRAFFATSNDPGGFDYQSYAAKEGGIRTLAGMGLSAISQDISSATIIVQLSASIQRTMACTVFDLLNRLEKLDGAITVLKPKWTLDLRVPLGGRKGLIQWEMLIMQLYPWLSVRETSVNTLAEEPTHKANTPVSPKVETVRQVRLLRMGEEKILTIKAIRTHTHPPYSLPQAREAVENMPSVLNVADPEQFCAEMKRLGNTVDDGTALPSGPDIPASQPPQPPKADAEPKRAKSLWQRLFGK